MFSVEHPIYTAPAHPGWVPDGDGQQSWPLNSYQIEGERRTDWLVEGVVKQHRTIATYVNTLIRHGFRLQRLEEWGPTPEELSKLPELESEIQRPTFLLVAAHRDAVSGMTLGCRYSTNWRARRAESASTRSSPWRDTYAPSPRAAS